MVEKKSYIIIVDYYEENTSVPMIEAESYAVDEGTGFLHFYGTGGRTIASFAKWAYVQEVEDDDE